MEQKEKNKIEGGYIVSYIAIAGVAILAIIAITAIAVILGKSLYYDIAVNTSFNATACSKNSLPQNCGIPAGMLCTVLNSTTPGLICLDYWVSPNGKQVYISNTSNIQNVTISNSIG